MILRSLLYFICYFCCTTVYSQFSQFIQPPIEIKTPTATAFETYGKFPISLYTGTPNITVPLYTISYEGINIPIELSYNASGNRVNSRPTWVGLGWNLNCGGVITRKVNQEPDEWVTDSDPTHPGYLYGYMYNFNKLNYSDWEDKLDDYSYYPNDPDHNVRIDYEADEFTFNFLGFSGRFFMNHLGEWQVISENKIKVEVFLADASQLREQVGGDLPTQVNTLCKKWIHKFTLTTPDGYKFEFGGTNATEYSINAKYLDLMAPRPDAWYLTKVTNPSGKYVEFTYSPDKVIDAFYRNLFYSRSDSEGEDDFFMIDLDISCSVISQSSGTFDGDLLFPVYLSRIEYEGGKIDFHRTPAVQLEYFPDLFNGLASWYTGVNPGRGFDGTTTYYTFENYDIENSNPSPFGRFKLEDIEIYNYKKDAPKLKYNFKYLENASSRLKLESILRGVEGFEKETYYSFTYNSLSLPSYSSLQVDHWGFYNNSSADFINNYKLETFDFNSAKAPNPTYMVAEIIDKVYFSTGGYSKFIFEPHSYSRHLLTDRSALTNDPSETIAGGLRIKRIESYSSANSSTPSLVQEYLYKKSFNLQTPINSLQSSGILDVMPEYRWPFYGKTIDGNNFTSTIISVNSLVTMGQSISGSHIGYENVVELNKDSQNNISGYTIHEFTNYSTDRWGNTHMDALGTRLLDHSRAIYSPIISLHNERGKVVSITSFDSNDMKVMERLFKYEKSADSDIRMMKLEPIDVCSWITASRQTKFGTTYKVPGYDYRLKEIVENHYVNNILTLSQNELLTYNSYKLITKSQKLNSDGKTMEVTTRYTSDFSRFDGLAALNILNSPIQTEVTSNGKVIGGTLRDLSLSGSSLGDVTGEYLYESTTLLSPTYNRTVFPPSNYVKKTTYTYNTVGKLIGYLPADGIQRTYLWGYKNQYPVAEVKGASFSDIASSFNQSILDNPTDDTALRLELNKVRLSLNSQNKGTIGYFTYSSPFGVSSSTDSNGVITSYYFDTFGRYYLTRDYQGNILKMIDYVIGK